jgi:glutamine amidotransferase
MSEPTVALIDYGMGNRRSVEKALAHVGAVPAITRDEQAIRAADAIVLPGVGAFPRGMANLRSFGLDELLRERAGAGVPILGVCLGLQLLFDSSTELEPTAGIGLIPGEVSALQAGSRTVPHIGWNEVRLERPSALTNGLSGWPRPFYHVHTYVARPSDPQDVLGTAEYGERFATIVGRGAVFGVQFHPEKSSTDGLKLLSAFVALAGEQASQARVTSAA